jgi:L-lactate utilization protein LutC
MTNWTSGVSQEVVESTRENLQKNGFEVEILENKKVVLARLKELIPEKSEVMTGSSTTLNQIGFTDLLKEGKHPWKNLNATIWAENDEDKRNELRRKSITAEYYLASANAITQDGEIVAVDATGSRVGAFHFGAKHLVLVVSASKIVKDLPTAMKRIREHVFPLEDQRMQEAYGMGSNFSKWVILEKEFTPGRVRVLLVEEELGF